VLFINLERSAASVADRLGNVNRGARAAPDTRPMLTLNARGRSLMDVAGSARKAIEQHGVQRGVPGQHLPRRASGT
jgi:hypothetical protein